MCFVKFESTVVTFDSGVVGSAINVVSVPLPKFSATSQTLSLRHLTCLPMPLPVTHLLHNASGIEVLEPRMAGPRAGRFEWQPFRQLLTLRKMSMTLLCYTAELVLTAF